MLMDIQARYHQFSFPQNDNVAKRSGRRMKSWMSSLSKNKSGTQEMKSCDLNVNVKKTPTYVFPRLKKYDRSKTT